MESAVGYVHITVTIHPLSHCYYALVLSSLFADHKSERQHLDRAHDQRLVCTLLGRATTKESREVVLPSHYNLAFWQLATGRGGRMSPTWLGPFINRCSGTGAEASPWDTLIRAELDIIYLRKSGSLNIMRLALWLH
jgi:hypothetical protein